MGAHAGHHGTLGQGDKGPGQGRGQSGATLQDQQGRLLHCQDCLLGKLSVRSISPGSSPSEQTFVSQVVASDGPCVLHLPVTFAQYFNLSTCSYFHVQLSREIMLYYRK